jgi:transposase-like protein
MGYTEAFKEQMVKRMLGLPAVSASALSKQVDVPQPTLSQWLRAAFERGATAPSAEETTQPMTSFEVARGGGGNRTHRPEGPYADPFQGE